MSTQASERPPPPDDEALFDAADVAAEPAPHPPTVEEGTVDRLAPDGPAATEAQPPSDATAESGDEARADTAEDAEADHGTAAAGKRKPRKAPSGKGRSKGRASVPSWDEIMFGSGRGD